MKPMFRIYCYEAQEMIVARDYKELAELFAVLDADDSLYSEPMQSTGLKDKSDNEIFEGDIVRYECCFESYVEEVIYDDNHCKFGTIDKDKKTFSFDALISDFDVDYFEVVGNKYENPELLGE